MEAVDCLTMVIKGESDQRLLDPSVLHEAIEKVCVAEMRNYHGTPPKLNLDNWDSIAKNDGRIADERILPIYYVLRMALRNAFRHAEASSISVSFAQSVKGLCFTVEDDGRGFVVPPPRDRKRGGLYLMGIMARSANGKVEIQSEPGCGTKVRLTLHREKQDGSEREGTLAAGR